MSSIIGLELLVVEIFVGIVVLFLRDVEIVEGSASEAEVATRSRRVLRRSDDRGIFDLVIVLGL